jgi:malto-oligosyltrehalose trehalohydrolase
VSFVDDLIASPQRADLPAAVVMSHQMPAGATVTHREGIRFRLWAPEADAVWLRCEGHDQDLLMKQAAGGWHALMTNVAGPGTRYRYRLPDGTLVPDPASRFQPEGVGGPSEVIDPTAYRWGDAQWVAPSWADAIVYELHVGTFTAEGTFRAAIAKLDHVVNLGATCINLMPVAQFPGERNWGYDGVFLYAPASQYGRPEDLKALVDGAHARGLMVMLDVVYNHFGPDGNWIPTYAPQIFADRHQTPWGAAVNFDGEGSDAVRDFVIHNALYWLIEFHFDGLRLDAVHAIIDDSDKHILEELAERVRAACAPRRIHLVVENEANQATRLERDEVAVPKQYTAQWNDDVHHVLHTALTNEADSYYVDFEGDTEKMGRALAEGFAFQGETMRSNGKPRGQSSARLPPSAFVSFLQNHDQVGNRAMGDRIHAIAAPEATRAAAAVYLLLPQVPMVFMAEEWGSKRPFPFFCDFAGEMGELVTKGRRDEFSDFAAFHDPEQREKIPDPQDVNTFALAKIDWSESSKPEHVDWLDWYRRVIATRKREIVPLVDRIAQAGVYEVIGRGAVVVRFAIGGSDRVLTLAANLSATISRGCPEARGDVIWSEGPDVERGILKPWSVRWTLESFV